MCSIIVRKVSIYSRITTTDNYIKTTEDTESTEGLCTYSLSFIPCFPCFRWLNIHLRLVKIFGV